MNAPFADFSRREALSTLAVAAAGLAATPALAVIAGNKPQPAGTTKPASPQPATPPAPAPAGPLVLPPLPYGKAALEPSIDAETMEIHHDRHHKAYVDNANKALAGTKWADASPQTIIPEIIGGLADIEDPKLRATLRNNVGGHVNHSMFWMTMAPAGKGGGGEPTGALADALSAFGSFAGEGGFKEKFAAAGTSRFGSGWAWLVVTADKKLAICSTANQDNPLMGDKIAGCSGTPILGLDVWEHAYYLKYRNLRAGYIKAWWDVVNWSAVSGLYTAAMKKG